MTCKNNEERKMVEAIIFIAAIVALTFYYKNKSKNKGNLGTGKPGKPVKPGIPTQPK
jgi:hypothetical protein